MNRSRILTAALVAGACAALALAFVLRRNSPVAPPAPVPSDRPAVPQGPDPASASAAPPLWARRVGGEALVLSFVPSGSGSVSSSVVEFLGGKGEVLGGGRLDPAGAWRGTIPQGAGSLSLRRGGGATAAWRLPALPSATPGIRAEPAVLRPGETLRVSIREAHDADSDPVLRFEPADGDVPALPLVPAESGPPLPGGWWIFESRIPDDVRPGYAVVSHGGAALRIPVEGRSPASVDARGEPDAPPPAGSTALRLVRDGDRWIATGPADAGAILFFAESGGRLLSHQAVSAMEGVASVDLRIGSGEPGPIRVTAVASTPAGFVETSIGFATGPLPAAPGDGPAGPTWIHEGDAPAAPGPAPPARPGYLPVRGRVLLRPGLEESVLLPGGARVRWSVVPAGAAGTLRVRGDGEILVEARVAYGKGEGILVTADPSPRLLLLESEAPGIEGLALEWTLGGRAAEAPGAPGWTLSVDRRLPARGRAGDVVEYHVEIRWTASRAPTEIVCPIPRGAVLAEDGWEIRARAPGGTRVETPDGAVVLRIPAGEAGTAGIAFRIRLAFPGRWAAPAAVAGTDSESARSASGFLVIE